MASFTHIHFLAVMRNALKPQLPTYGQARDLCLVSPDQFSWFSPSIALLPVHHIVPFHYHLHALHPPACSGQHSVLPSTISFLLVPFTCHIYSCHPLHMSKLFQHLFNSQPKGGHDSKCNKGKEASPKLEGIKVLRFIQKCVESNNTIW